MLSERKKGSCKVLCNFCALCTPKPGHNSREPTGAFTIFAKVPKLDKSVVASVLFTDLTEVKALISWKKLIYYFFSFSFS